MVRQKRAATLSCRKTNASILLTIAGKTSAVSLPSPHSSPAPSRRSQPGGTLYGLPGATNKRWALLVVLVLLVLGPAGAFAPLGMSEPAQVALVTLLVAATLWVSEAVPLFVTSFVVLAMNLSWLLPSLQKAGQDVVPGLYLAPFFSDIVLLFLGGFVVSQALHKQGLDELVARWMIKRAGHSVPLLVLSVMATTAVFSMWLSNTATAAMMLALCLPIAHKLPESDRYRKALILAVPFGANVGGLATPIGTPPNAIAMRYLNQAGAEVTFGDWLLIGVPGAVVMVIAAWLLLMYLFRGKARGIEVDAFPPARALGAASKVVLGVCSLTALGWTTTGLTGLSVGTVALLPIIVLYGFGFMRVAELKTLSWDVLLVMGGGLTLGKAIESSGLAHFLVQQLPGNDVEQTIMVVVFATMACVMSSIMSNTATANLLMPIVLGMSGDSVGALLVGVAFGCSLAMPLPISTPPNAMAFSTGELSVKDLLRPGLILTVLGLALALTTGFWWWRLVGVV